MDYTTYSKGAGGKQIPLGKISVKGGAGVADKKTLLTPQGVATPVSAEELKGLKLNPVFLAHEKKGLLKTLADLPRNPDKAAKDMEADKGEQLTPADYEAQGKKPPAAGGES
jgi:hypothetical protein